MKQDYNLGDECWIFAGDENQKTGRAQMSRGIVVHKFKLPYGVLWQYVIQLDDPDFMHLEIRDVYCMAGSEGVMPAVAELASPSKAPPRSDKH